MSHLARSLQALALAGITAGAGAQAPLLGGRGGATVDYHVHIKGDLTLDDALRRSRETGIAYGIAVNGGLSFPINSDAGLEAFLREMRGKPVLLAFQAEGREWVRLFSRGTLAKFDYVFTDAMTWTDDRGRRMRLWMPEEVGAIADPQAFMDMLVARATAIFDHEPIDLYVNPTFLPQVIAVDYDRLWTPERMQAIVKGLTKNGIGMEINNRYRIPSAAFIRLAKQAGVRFACGTNNTGAADLGRNEYCAEMIRQCDLGAANFWTPPVDGQKAVQRKPLAPSAPGRDEAAAQELDLVLFGPHVRRLAVGCGLKAAGLGKPAIRSPRPEAHGPKSTSSGLEHRPEAEAHLALAVGRADLAERRTAERGVRVAVIHVVRLP
jgi:hypothetical protein